MGKDLKVTAHPKGRVLGVVGELKRKYNGFYKGLGKIYCPAIDSDIVFNYYGWQHFEFDTKGHRRPTSNIAFRFSLLPYVPDVVKNGRKAKENEETTVNIKGTDRKVTYYVIARESNIGSGKKHVTVILRRIENENIHYYSLRLSSYKIKEALRRGLI